MCKCLEEEIEALKAEVKREAERADTWRSLWELNGNTISDLRATLSNTKAELSDVRSDLADTTATLDNYRDLHVQRSRTNSVLRKSVSDLEDTVRTLTEERDLARELFQGMVSKHAELLNRCSQVCDEYGDVFSRRVDVLWRSDSEHGKF